MQDPRKQHGHFSWNELMTTDVPAAKLFYSDMFGWSYEDMNPNGMDYSIASAGETQVAGLMPIPEEAKGMPPMWGSYVTVDDVDAAAKQVVELGGKVLSDAMDIPEVGRLIFIQDPQGVVLSIITYVKE